MSGSTVSHRAMAAMTQGMCQNSWGAVRPMQICAMAIPATAGHRPRGPRTIKAPEETPAEGQKHRMPTGWRNGPQRSDPGTRKMAQADGPGEGMGARPPLVNLGGPPANAGAERCLVEFWAINQLSAIAASVMFPLAL